MRESKEKIESRMIRNASRIWGFKEPQPEGSFDPVLSLLLGSCAFELEKISREINSTESRIIERLVNILTPQPITGPHPAYAVAYAMPTKKGATADPGYQFYTEIKVNKQAQIKEAEKQIFFSPTGTFKLNDGRVRYIAANKRVYEYVNGQYKDILTESFKNPLPASSLFVGIEMNEKLSEITFFFDVISEHLKTGFFQDLENAQWNYGEIPMESSIGLRDLERRKYDVNQLINRELDLSSKISEHVNRFFTRQFVHLDFREIEKILKQGEPKIPEVLSASIDEKELANIDETIIWLELQLSMPVQDELLEGLSCSLNCFPVINRRRNEFTGSTRESINIIPLHTDDVFFGLKQVTNSKGEFYRIRHFESQGDLVKGSALLRQEGVGRFDVRSAMEFLEYLLELMKEESAAFNVIGSDMIASNLRELNQSIARLEKKMEDTQLEKGDTAYLLLKPQEDDRQVFVEFWSTNCSYANNIRAGTTLNIYDATDLDFNASRMMTMTIGGKEKPSTEDRINTYRRALQSGDRVVTSEDIKALCFEHLGDSISQVRIEKGIEKGGKKAEGFLRTIDVYLKLKDKLEPGITEQNALRHKLLVLLEERSSNILPYRIFIEK